MARILLSVMLIVVSAGGLAAPALAQDGANDKSDLLFRQGVEAYDAKRFTEAERLFSEALAIREASDIAANLASTQLELQKYREAATNFQLALATLPASAKLDQKTALYKQLATAKAQVLTVNVKVNVSCQVKASPAPAVPAAPGGTTIVYVEAGSDQVITVTADGYDPQKTPVNGARGSTVTVVVELKVATAPVVPPPTSPLVPAWAPVTTGVISAVGLGLGIAGFVLFAGADADADAAATAIGPGSARCVGAAAPAACSDLANALDDRSTFGTLGIFGLVGGGVFLTATVVLAVLHVSSGDGADSAQSSRGAPPNPGFSATVGVSPTGVRIHGSF